MSLAKKLWNNKFLILCLITFAYTVFVFEYNIDFLKTVDNLSKEEIRYAEIQEGYTVGQLIKDICVNFSISKDVYWIFLGLFLVLLVADFYIYLKKKKKNRMNKQNEIKVKKENDFYNTGTPKELLDVRNNQISERWEQLYHIQVKSAEDILKYLFLVNSGSAVAILSFMGACSEIRNLISMRWALACFVLGIISVGIVRTIIVHRTRNLFNNWRKDTDKYYSQEIGFSELEANDEKRTKSDAVEFVLGYLSAGFLIMGYVFGAYGFFNR